MPLLLKTDIEGKVDRKIRGRVARAGGSVGQLVNYANCRVEDINILDGGFGNVLKFGSLSNIRKVFRILRKYPQQELAFWRHGSVRSRDRKTIILDLHNAVQEKPFLEDRYECSISSNMIEHSPNPIFLLLNFYYITQKDGYQYHAIPHYKYTYDRYRKTTKLEHLISDFTNMTDVDDQTHNEDYIQSAVVKDGWQRDFHKSYPVKYPFIHFHVFDENIVKELFEYMFEDVTNDILRTDVFSDNVVVCRNSLNPDFLAEHRPALLELGIIPKEEAQEL
ncbi:MAG: hypothetical protein KKE17_01480 [Proteobacteria bacterium]|nr:hypothetical protein [Pseudomonadota bacterium]